MATDTQLRHSPRQLDGLTERASFRHQGRRGDYSTRVSLDDCTVYARGESKIIRIDDQPLHPESVAGGRTGSFLRLPPYLTASMTVKAFVVSALEKSQIDSEFRQCLTALRRLCKAADQATFKMQWTLTVLLLDSEGAAGRLSAQPRFPRFSGERPRPDCVRSQEIRRCRPLV